MKRNGREGHTKVIIQARKKWRWEENEGSLGYTANLVFVCTRSFFFLYIIYMQYLQRPEGASDPLGPELKINCELHHMVLEIKP